MRAIDYAQVRNSLATMPSDHDASGQHRPTVSEIFAPDQHANALDPNTPIVVGARGAGKSFWAGVLEQADTRKVAAQAYPHLGLDRLVVQPGYTGFAATGVVSAKTIETRVPRGNEDVAVDFWLAVIVRAARAGLSDTQSETIKAVMERFSDPEDLEEELRRLDEEMTSRKKILLVTFDALDTLSREWKRSSLLIDALFEAIWSLRARKSLRAKIFIRPEQLNDESLRFIELPKLRSGRVELEWTQLDLYGLLFWRLRESESSHRAPRGFSRLAMECGYPVPKDVAVNRQGWPAVSDRDAQNVLIEAMAGRFMGKTHKKGGTYDWPYKHLGDANGKVTPRSFIKLFVEAAKFGQAPEDQVISAEGIRHGLREASKVRVDQLGIEYPWVKRALAPLAGLMVPCTLDALYERWTETNTVKRILTAATDSDTGFLPPFPPRAKGDPSELLATAMEKIGLLSYRSDGRVDIPDLFRVAALMLKKGSTAPVRKR